MADKKTFKSFIFIISFITMMASILSFITWGTVRIYKCIVFNKNCTEYISNSAHVNSIKVAKKELDHAILYLEEKNLTEGRVSIVSSQIANDIGYFYENLKVQQEFLDTESKKELNSEEETAILMKYRSNIGDYTSDKLHFSLNIPDGISIYPNNVAYFWWAIISILIFIISFLIFSKIEIDYQHQN